MLHNQRVSEAVIESELGDECPYLGGDKHLHYVNERENVSRERAGKSEDDLWGMEVMPATNLGGDSEQDLFENNGNVTGR